MSNLSVLNTLNSVEAVERTRVSTKMTFSDVKRKFIQDAQDNLKSLKEGKTSGTWYKKVEKEDRYVFGFKSGVAFLQLGTGNGTNCKWAAPAATMEKALIDIIADAQNGLIDNELQAAHAKGASRPKGGKGKSVASLAVAKPQATTLASVPLQTSTVATAVATVTASDEQAQQKPLQMPIPFVEPNQIRRRGKGKNVKAKSSRSAAVRLDIRQAIEKYVYEEVSKSATLEGTYTIVNNFEIDYKPFSVAVRNIAEGIDENITVSIKQFRPARSALKLILNRKPVTE